MKRFENFGEYMFDLLFSPLKRGKQVINQFYIFFKVVGREFDDIKKAFFQVRDEANVISASPSMLPVFGQDRDMSRLAGEDVESYRTRLSMKALIARNAGTRQGILLALAALGYGTCEIEPMVYRDPGRWAEFLVRISFNLNDMMPVNISLIKKVVKEIKPGSAKDNYEFAFFASQKVEISNRAQIHFTISFYPRFNLPELLLDGTWIFDGNHTLSGYDSEEQIDFYPVYVKFETKAVAKLKEHTQLHFLMHAEEMVKSLEIVAIKTSAECGIASEQRMGLCMETAGTPEEETKVSFFLGSAKEQIESRQKITVQVSAECREGTTKSMAMQVAVEVSAGAGEVIVENRNMLDGTWLLDGSRKLNGGIYQL